MPTPRPPEPSAPDSRHGGNRPLNACPGRCGVVASRRDAIAFLSTAELNKRAKFWDPWRILQAFSIPPGHWMRKIPEMKPSIAIGRGRRGMASYS